MKREIIDINRLKEVVDIMALAKSVLSGKMNFWARIFGKFGKIKSLIEKCYDIFQHKEELIGEMKGLSMPESIQLSTYGCEKLGGSKEVQQAIQEFLQGIEHIIKGLEIIKK